MQAAKLFTSRDGYTTGHIYIPEEDHRLSAIAFDNQYYSFFRALNDPTKALGILMKLTARGDQVALTPTSRGYALWVHEPDALPALPVGIAPRVLPPIFGPADCWVMSDRQPGYRTCSLRVPDLRDAVPGLTNEQKLYSLYRRESSPDAAIRLAARLTQRGDESILLVSTAGYAICIYEPGATLVVP